MNSDKLAKNSKNFFIILVSLLLFFYYYDNNKVLVRSYNVKSKYNLNSYIENKNGININTANYEELLSVPNISKKNTEAIISERIINGEYIYIEDIIYAKGIGDSKFKKLKKYLIVE